MLQQRQDSQNRPIRISDNRGGAQRGGHQRDRGRGRGDYRGGRSRASPAYPQNVPTIQEVAPGASVSIVLKVDQPTGREVQGTVAEVLTNGNHPRGIKVRLRDGRVGRVQRMVTKEEAAEGEAGLSNLGRKGEPAYSTTEIGGRQSRFTSRYTDARDEWHPDTPNRQPLSLGDYLKPGSRGLEEEQEAYDRQPSQPSLTDGTDFVSTTSTCPVCGTFEGDEAAVSHHVQSHFTD